MIQLQRDMLDKSMTYDNYLDHIKKELARGYSTSGHTSDTWLEYSRMNLRRMQRLNRTVKIIESIIPKVRAIDRPLTFVTITEGWCGDAAQIIPVIEQLALLNAKIGTRYILRDEHPDIMNAFLTGESRSIPIVIILDTKTGTVLGHWGPRPSTLQQSVLDAKEKMAAIEDQEVRREYYANSLKEWQRWYNRDKGKTIQAEFLTVLQGSLDHVHIV